MPGETFYDVCQCGNRKQRRSKRCGDCAQGVSVAAAIQPPTPAPSPSVAGDREKQRQADALSSLKGRYKEALERISVLESQTESFAALSSGVETFTIEPKQGSGTSEGTVVAVASDWHIEETVGPEVSSLNTYNVEIAERR